MNTYEIFIRRKDPPGTLEFFRDTCQANTREEADKIFTDRHGRGFVVAGPNKVKTS